MLIYPKYKLGSSPEAHLARMVFRVRVRVMVRFRVRVRVRAFSRSREVRFWTRPDCRYKKA